MSTATITPEVVILNPDHFVAVKLSGLKVADVPRFLAARRSTRVKGRSAALICIDCLHGRHKFCDHTTCPCVHHEVTFETIVECLRAEKL
jgi:predicted N-acyltransferase